MHGEILVLDAHADVYAEELRRAFPALHIRTARSLAEVPADISRVEVLIAFGIAIDDDLMQRLTGLKWVQSLATGVDHFLRCPTLAPGVLITSGRGIHGPSMRESTAYLMLSLAQNARQRHADQTNHHWQRRLWTLLCGKIAVVVGVGVAGSAIAGLLKAFGMTVVGVSRSPRRLTDFDELMPRARLYDAAARADYLINVLPGDRDNYRVFDASVFAAMKPTAFFINVGRGETVDEPALVQSLQIGRIAGAGLDVFAVEPLPKESPLWDMPNVVLTPHVAGFFVEYESYIMPLIVENMRLYLEGKSQHLLNLVAR